MDNIVKANFSNDNYGKFVTGLVQWDINQELHVLGLDLPEEVEIHFSLDEIQGNAKRVLGTTKDGVTTVKIPQFVVEGKGCWGRTYNAFAWIYLSDNISSETIRKIVFEIQTRPKPEDYVYTEEEVKTYDELKKRIENAGTVKTVNNIEPDENGNVDIQSEILYMLESAKVILPLHADADTLFTNENGKIFIL